MLNKPVSGAVALSLGLLLAACTTTPDKPTPATATSAPAPAASSPAAQTKPKAATASTASAAKPAPASNLKSYDEVIKDFTRLPGYLVIYKKDERYLLELKEQDFKHPFFFTTARTRGIGERGMWGGLMLESGVGSFVRHSDKVQWIERNTAFVAPQNAQLKRALADGFSDSLRGSGAILSQPHPQTKAILVDLNSLLLSDFSATATALQATYHQPYQFDRANTLIQRVHNESDETSISIQAHYAANALAVPQPNQPAAPITPATLPDPRSMFFGFTVNFSPLPAQAHARPADPRVGYFVTEQRNYDNDLSAHNRDFLISRWRLEKQNPTAELSPPKKPITYWLDKNIPERYRDTVKRGILAWNAAFERIGFKDAIEVKQQPDNASWDASQRKYASVKWYLGTDNSAAIGPSLVDPRSGEILDADIVIGDFWTRNPRTVFVNDLPRPKTAMEDTEACDYAANAFADMQQTLDLLIARGEIAPDSPEADAFVQDTLYWVVMHEVGHTLGLRHNFRASSVYTLAQLHDPEFVAKHGITASVMDYVPNNVPVKGQKATAYTQKILGPYDYWAIEYGYKPLAEDAEQAGLRGIAERSATDPYLAYGTDEDAGSFGLATGIDPAVARFDLGDDPVAWLRQRLQLDAELWAALAQRPPTGKPEESADLRSSVERSLGMLSLAANNAARNIGGVRVVRHTSPSQREVFVPIPVATQRATLDALSKGLFQPESFRLDPDLLRRLAPSPLEAHPLEPQLPLLAIVQQIQGGVLDQLFSDRVTARLLEAELTTPAAQRLPLAELYATLHRDIWQELRRGGDIPLIRRNLQRAYLTRLCNQILRASPVTPSDARSLARHEAQLLQAELRAALSRSHAGAATQAHLQESLATLDEVLRAPLLRQVP